jgi:outer membrane protein
LAEEASTPPAKASIGLEEVFAAALEANPSLQIALSKLEVGRAQRSQSTAQLLPQISAGANLSENEQDFVDSDSPVTEFPGEKYNLQLQQVLFNWQAFANRKRASYIVDQRESEYFEALGTLLSQTSERYFGVLAAEDKRALIAAERETLSEQLKQAERRFERKLIKVTDLFEVRSRLAMIRTDEIDAESEVALAKEALWEVSGLEIDRLHPLNEDIDFPEIQGNLNLWVGRAMSDSRQLRARDYALKAARATISERRGAHYPTVNLVASRQKSDIGYENTPSQKRLSTYYGVNVSIPIYSGGSSSAKVREAYHMAEMAKSEHELVRREVVRRTRAAFLSANSSLKRIEASKTAVKAAAASATAMKRGFQLGTVTVIEVFDALRHEFRAQRDLQQAKYAYIHAMLSLKKEAGSISQADIGLIHSWLLPAS